MFVFIVASKSSVDVSRIDSRLCWRPAFITRMSRPPSPCTGLIDEILAEGLVANVARNGEARPPALPDERDDLARVRLLLRKVVDGDVRAFARRGDRPGAAHAGIAARDQRLAAGEPSGAAIAGLAVVRPGIHLARKTGQGCDCLGNGGFGYLSTGFCSTASTDPGAILPEPDRGISGLRESGRARGCRRETYAADDFTP
jgi:hypothetical protein